MISTTSWFCRDEALNKSSSCSDADGGMYPSDCSSVFSILIFSLVTTAAEGSTTCQRPLDRRTILRMAMNSTKLLDEEVSFGMPWLVDDIVEEAGD